MESSRDGAERKINRQRQNVRKCPETSYMSHAGSITTE